MTANPQAPFDPSIDLKAVKDLLAQHSITKIKIGGFDIDGILRGKYIHRDKFDSSTESGLGFCDVIFGWDSADALYDNAKVTGWHTGYPDMLAKIDLSTFRVILCRFLLVSCCNASSPRRKLWVMSP